MNTRHQASTLCRHRNGAGGGAVAEEAEAVGRVLVEAGGAGEGAGGEGGLLAVEAVLGEGGGLAENAEPGPGWAATLLIQR